MDILRTLSVEAQDDFMAALNEQRPISAEVRCRMPSTASPRHCAQPIYKFSMKMYGTHVVHCKNCVVRCALARAGRTHVESVLCQNLTS